VVIEVGGFSPNFTTEERRDFAELFRRVIQRRNVFRIFAVPINWV